MAVSKNKRVVVIGTDATIASHAYQRALAACGLESCEKACPLLVPLVEEGWVDHPVTEQVARIYLSEAFTDGFRSADVLQLGSTHYPLLKPLLHRVVSPDVALVVSAESIALAVLNLTVSGSANVGPGLENEALLPEKRALRMDHVRFFVTDSTEKFKRLGTLFLGQQISDITHIDLKE